MTFESTDLHPSHDWREEEENDFRYYMCGDCYACSCCVGSGATRACIGEEGFLKELSFDED